MQITVTGNLATIIAPFQKVSTRGIDPLREGLYEGGDKVKTQVRKALKKQTNVLAYATITSRVDGKRAGLTYKIEGKGSGLAINLFPVSASGAVTASPWGVSRTFKRSFVTKAKGAFRARLSSKRMPIRSLRGPSIAKEIVKDQSLAAFDAGVRSLIVPMIEKRLARLMG